MKALSKDDKANRGELVEKLDAEAKKVLAEWAKVEEAVAAYNTAIGVYNAVLDDVSTFIDEKTGEMDDYMSDKTERWLEGDNGQAYESWKSEWESIDLEAAETLTLESDFETDHTETTEALQNLPERPE